MVGVGKGRERVFVFSSKRGTPAHTGAHRVEEMMEEEERECVCAFKRERESERRKKE